ncbi:MAG: hypothetical protein LBN18_01335, partial [Dysgonamonadaceae bacterium]|nr:hypothetical protein [Dysgonamonadaceae bacterium]
MTIKEQEYAQIRKDFQWLSEMLMLQMEIAQELVVNSWSDNIYEQIIQKKEEIRYLHNQLQDALQTLIVQFSPRAAELRQIVAYYSVMLAMGQINKILIQLVDRIHQSSLIINNYTDNLESVQALFATTQGMVASALF